MSQKGEDENGNEIELFTAAELEEQKQAEVARVAAEKDAEIERLKKVSSEKTENFRKYNEMTEEERKSYDANTTNLLIRGDHLEEQVTTLTKTLAEKEERERLNDKTNALAGFHGGSEEVKKTLEEKYALLAAMPETSPQEIFARATEAAKLAGISVDSRNPIYQTVHGAPPVFKERTDFTDTNEGKAAADVVREAMGLPKPN